MGGEKGKGKRGKAGKKGGRTSESSCSTKRVMERRVETEGGAPLRRTVPEVERAWVGREARWFKSVVLPEPEGPMRASISPVGRVSE